MGTTVILRKITDGTLYVRGDHYRDYTLIEEFYYSYEILFKDSAVDRFFIDINGGEFSRLYIAGVSLYNLKCILKHHYSDLYDSKGLNVKIGYLYKGETHELVSYNELGRFIHEQNSTIKEVLDKLIKNKELIDKGYNIEFKIIHSKA